MPPVTMAKDAEERDWQNKREQDCAAVASEPLEPGTMMAAIIAVNPFR